MAMSFEEYLNKEMPCECGRTHVCGISEILIEREAVRHIPRLIQEGHYLNVCVLDDGNTAAALGGKVSRILRHAGIPHEHVTLPGADLLPDENGIGSVITGMPSCCGLLIAVGTGTLNDLARFVSYKMGIPYMIAATAPSMDGFASGVAAMITRHAKTTYEAHKPVAIIGDLDVLAEAPMNLIAAGIGDMLGKCVCLTDWQLSRLITGEYYCGMVADLVRQSVEKVKSAAEGIQKRDGKAIVDVMEGLVLSGIAMSYVGSSRPASGSEHHLSHFWEMTFLQNGGKDPLHGAKVGVGTVVCLELYQKFLSARLDFDALMGYEFDQPGWEERINRAYGNAAPSVVALEKETGKNSTPAVRERLLKIADHYADICALAAALPSPDEIRSLLNSLGAPSSPSQLGVTQPMLSDSILFAKDLRNRYGLLQLLYDTGLAEGLAEQIAI